MKHFLRETSLRNQSYLDRCFQETDKISVTGVRKIYASNWTLQVFNILLFMIIIFCNWIFYKFEIGTQDCGHVLM